MEGWKSGPGILTVANTAGFGFAFAMLWKKLSDLDSRVTALDTKCDVLYQKVGGPTKDLFDKMVTKYTQWERIIPTMGQEAKDEKTRVSHTRRDVGEMQNSLTDMDTLLQTILIILTESKEIKLSDDEKAELAQWQTNYQPPAPPPSRFPPRGGYQPPPPQPHRGRGGAPPRGAPRGRGAPPPPRGSRTLQRPQPYHQQPYYEQPYYDQQDTADQGGYDDETSPEDDDILGPRNQR